MTEKDLDFANELLRLINQLKQEIKETEDHLSMPMSKRSIELLLFSEHQRRLSGKALLELSKIDVKDLITTLDAGLVIPALNALKNELRDLEMNFESI